MAHVDFENRLAIADHDFSAFKIEAITRYFLELGIPAEDTLQSTGLTIGLLNNIETRASLSQLIQVWHNIHRIRPCSAIGLQIGQTIKISTYGFYGYALLCAGSLRKGIESAIRYRNLVMPTTKMYFEQVGMRAQFTFEDSVGLKEFYQFNLEMQVSLVYSILRDAVGPSFKLDRINFAFDAPHYKDMFATIFECDVEFNRPKTQLIFSAILLDQSLPHSNPITEAIVNDRCEKLIAEQGRSNGFAKRLYELISKSPSDIPSCEEAARYFGMTSRTLRRKLSSCGTSYQDIIDHFRRDRAVSLLLNTDLNAEKIASLVGFNDVANFRAAFRRWTGKTPGCYRK